MALDRAARLTPGAEPRARRLLKASLAAEEAGWLEQAETMLADAAELTEDPELRAQAVARRSYLLFDRGEFDRAYALAVTEAESAAAGEVASAATSGALRILWRRMDMPNAVAMADRVGLAGQSAEANLDLDTVVAWTWSLAGRVEEGRTLARASLEQTDPGTWLAIDFGTVLLYVEDYPGASDALEQVVEHLREAAAPGLLSYALDQLAKLETRVANLTRAYALELESLQLTEPLGNDVALASSLIWLALIESMLGRPESRGHVEHGLAIAERLHDPWNVVRARGVLGLDALMRADAAAAVEWLEPAVAVVTDGGVGHPNYHRLDADLIEALARVGRPEASERHLGRLEEQAQSTGSPWALAAAARCRAFLSTDSALQEAFETALELHDHEPSAFERARTELCYGERLRRAGQRRARARPAPVGLRDVCRARSATLGRAGADRAPGHRRAPPAARPDGRRTANAAGTADRTARRRRTDQPRRRRPPLPQSQDRRVPPDSDLPEARDPFTLGTRPTTRGRNGRGNRLETTDGDWRRDPTRRSRVIQRG